MKLEVFFANLAKNLKIKIEDAIFFHLFQSHSIKRLHNKLNVRKKSHTRLLSNNFTTFTEKRRNISLQMRYLHMSRHKKSYLPNMSRVTWLQYGSTLATWPTLIKDLSLIPVIRTFYYETLVLRELNRIFLGRSM